MYPISSNILIRKSAEIWSATLFSFYFILSCFPFRGREPLKGELRKDHCQLHDCGNLEKTKEKYLLSNFCGDTVGSGLGINSGELKDRPCEEEKTGAAFGAPTKHR